MSKQNVTLIIVAIVLCGVTAVVRHNYNTSADAVLWHARHGRYIQVGMLNIRVPLLYSPRVIGGKVMMMRLWHPPNISSIGFAAMTSDQDNETEIKRATQALALSKIAPQIELRAVVGETG